MSDHTRIYTRTGDDGTTGLVAADRVAKTDARIEAIGTVDELNAALGVALFAVEHETVKGTLLAIQNDLFDIGADLATPAPVRGELRISSKGPERLESAIDGLNEDLPALNRFILPSGPGGAGHLHLARAIARRAERCVWRLIEDGAGPHPINPTIPVYLNRLSDYLFVAARAVSHAKGGEVLWVPGGEAENGEN